MTVPVCSWNASGHLITNAKIFYLIYAPSFLLLLLLLFKTSHAVMLGRSGHFLPYELQEDWWIFNLIIYRRSAAFYLTVYKISAEYLTIYRRADLFFLLLIYRLKINSRSSTLQLSSCSDPQQLMGCQNPRTNKFETRMTARVLKQDLNT